MDIIRDKLEAGLSIRIMKLLIIIKKNIPAQDFELYSREHGPENSQYLIAYSFITIFWASHSKDHWILRLVAFLGSRPTFRTL